MNVSQTAASFSMSRKPKIGVLLSQPTPYRDAFIKRLASRDDFDIKVLFLGKVCGTWDWRNEPECDFPHVFVKLPEWFKNKHFTRWFHPELTRLLREEGFDVLIIGGYFIPSQLWAAVWCIGKGVPYVFWCESHERGTKTSIWRKLLRRVVIEPLLRRASALIAVGSYARERLVKSGVAEERISIILNSPDVDEWIEQTDLLRKERHRIREKLGLCPGPVLLFVGRLVPEKGIDELIEAYREVARNGQVEDLQLLLVGGGPMGKQLREKCRKLGLDGIHFAGFVSPNKLYPYYIAADALVLPSRHEPFGAVVHEAAAAGLPLIVSDCCGAVAELVHDGSNGMVVKAGDSKALAEAMMRFCLLKENWEQMGKTSRALAKKFDYNHAEEQFLRTIELSLRKGHV